jgi:NADH dehydrogenase (ubiquinone) flavoprotein 2
MVQLNDDYYECLTKETTIELLEACKKDQPPPMGKVCNFKIYDDAM